MIGSKDGCKLGLDEAASLVPMKVACSVLTMAASLVSIMAELGSNDSCMHCSENEGCMLGSDDGCKLDSVRACF